MTAPRNINPKSDPQSRETGQIPPKRLKINKTKPEKLVLQVSQSNPSPNNSTHTSAACPHFKDKTRLQRSTFTFICWGKATGIKL